MTRTPSPKTIKLNWKQQESLEKLFSLQHPGICPRCDHRGKPKINAKQFSHKAMVKFICSSCGYTLLVTDYDP